MDGGTTDERKRVWRGASLVLAARPVFRAGGDHLTQPEVQRSVSDPVQGIDTRSADVVRNSSGPVPHLMAKGSQRLIALDAPKLFGGSDLFKTLTITREGGNCRQGSDRLMTEAWPRFQRRVVTASRKELLLLRMRGQPLCSRDDCRRFCLSQRQKVRESHADPPASSNAPADSSPPVLAHCPPPESRFLRP